MSRKIVEIVESGRKVIEVYAFGGSAGFTSLDYVPSPTQGTISTGTGTDAIIPAGSTTYASLMLPADKNKLNDVATGATANSTDAQLRDRSTHTGTQAISTVSGLQAALDGKQPAGDYATNSALGSVLDLIIDAANFGITPSNPNNSIALQAFIDNQNNPDSLFFRKGTYTFLTPIVVSRNLKLHGEGPESTNFHFTNNSLSNTWAFDCTARSVSFKDLRIISTTGRNYTTLEGQLPPGFFNDGRNFGCLRFARTSSGGGGLGSVQGKLVDNVTIEGFSGYAASFHQAIDVQAYFSYVRWCLGVYVGNNRIDNATVSTTMQLHGYLNGCPRGWLLENAVDLHLDLCIAEYCGLADRSYAGFNLNSCRRIILEQPYGEQNYGSNIKAVDSRFELRHPDWYPPINGIPYEDFSYNGMAWADRGATKVDALGTQVLKRDGSGWVRFGLAYQGNNGFLGAGVDTGSGMQTIRTVDNTLFNAASTDPLSQSSTLQQGNFTYGTAVGSKVYGTAIAAGSGDVGTRHGSVFGCERTNSTGNGFNFYISSLVRGSAPIDRVGMTDTGHWYPVATGSQNLGQSANRWATAFITRLDIPSNGSARMPTGTTDPASPVSGEFYFNTSTNVLRIHNGTAWRSIATT